MKKKLTVRKTLMDNDEIIRCEELLTVLRRDIWRKHRAFLALRKKYYSVKGDLYQLKMSEETLTRKIHEHYEGVHIISSQKPSRPRSVSLSYVEKALRKMKKADAERVLQQMLRNLT